MSDVLYHPLGPLPWALASADESLRKTNKALLAKEPQRNLTAEDVILQPCAIVFNGMAMVHKVKGDQKTFAEMADSLMEIVLHEGTDSQCIDVVFDVYRDRKGRLRNQSRIQKHQGRSQNTSMAKVPIQC